MFKKNILFINGIPDDRKMLIQKIDKNGLIKWRGKGGTNLSNFLKNDLFDQYNVVFDLKGTQELPRQMIHAVFNQISDADTHKNVLKKTDSFYKTVSKHVPFFNPPANVMNTTRDNVYRLLQGVDKLHVPKTVKIQPKSPSDIYDTVEKEHFEFPVIFRQAGDHGGISTVRVDDKTEQFYAFPLDGRDYYLTQFVDYSDNAGVYTKYRLVVVDGEVYIRHVIFSDSWVIHSKSREYMEKNKKYQSQEEKILKSFNVEIKPKIKDVINEMYKKLKLDYFGVDCYIDKDMNILVFEINANMNILVNNAKDKNNIWTKQIDIIKNAIIAMIEKAKI
ncbi:ATP-grasp domain-containing protein [Sulfurimonas xiamenensis]|uniref:ATP-grasp domain-containing protein n=1 Tax=Sulfurimonas xiamenensis TaxID=2590021 RepID=A0AAJ4A4T5_9BACT|nr:hypothetical protein [Sulfurimonas xiamenensis]QFR43906.1 hypothetical protein FJR47_08265 [Sulfurimonas xiamenensis]